MFTIIVAACVLGLGPDEEQAYRAELLADARERTSFLSVENDLGAGHDGRGFVLADGGPNTLVIGGGMQFRYIANWRGDTDSPDSGFTSGFAFRRLRLMMGGTVISPRLSYVVQVDLMTEDRATLLDSSGEYKLSDSLSLRFGQFKLPFLYEEALSVFRPLTVERSTVSTVFGIGYSQGLMFQSTLGSMRLQGAFTDGSSASNTAYASGGSEADYAFTGRAELKWAGDWKQMDQFSSWRSSEYAGMLGAAVHIQDGGQTAAPGSAQGVTRDRTEVMYTADASVKGSGWNLFATGTGRHIEDDENGTSFDDFGFVASAGIFATDQLEPFVRYTGVYADEDRSQGSAWNEYAAGFNYFFVPESQAAKFTLDLSYMPDAQADSSSLIQANPVGTNLLASEGSQFMIRAQMQLVF
jgi:hypothetical protein